MRRLFAQPIHRCGIVVCILACCAKVALGQDPIQGWPPLDVPPAGMPFQQTAMLPNSLPLTPPATEELPSVLVPGEPAAPPTEILPDPTPPEKVLDQPEVFLLPDSWESWIFSPAWEGGIEIGINATEGNSESLSLRTGGNLKRKTDLWELKSNIIYAKTQSNGLETQHNAIFNSGYERFFGESKWSHFGKMNLEYDEFKAFDLRIALNAGLSYQVLKSDALSLKTRVGSGTSHEVNSPDTRWVPEAVFGADYSHKISERQKLTFTADYFPEWTDFANYRVVTDFAWSVALDDASKLSLKLSVNDRYDSTPNGLKPNDVIYSLLLLWQI